MVQCYNMGSDGTDAAWKCEASMPDGYSFSSVEVGAAQQSFKVGVLRGSARVALAAVRLGTSSGYRKSGVAYVCRLSGMPWLRQLLGLARFRTQICSSPSRLFHTYPANHDMPNPGRYPGAFF